MRARPTFPGGSSHRRRLSPRRLQGMEQLECRALLTVSVSNVHLAADTGSSSTDKITSDATLTGDATGTPPWGGSAQVQFDHYGNGTVDGAATISGGTFSYNPVATDSALENWEGALTIKYRTRELDGYGGVVSTGDWQTFDMTLDRKTPTGSLNTIYATESHSQYAYVDLHAAFADGFTPDSSLQYQVVSNTNSGLFDSVSISGGTLTIDYKSTGYGTADITIRASDQAGNYKDAVQQVVVVHFNPAPTIDEFELTTVLPLAIRFSGSVSDDTDMTGRTVWFWLDYSDVTFTAVIQSDHTFSVTHEVSIYDSYVVAWTDDVENATSELVWDYV